VPGIHCRPGRSPTVSDTHHEDAIYYNNQIVKDQRAVFSRLKSTPIHWTEASFALQKWLSPSDSVKPSGKE